MRARIVCFVAAIAIAALPAGFASQTTVTSARQSSTQTAPAQSPGNPSAAGANQSQTAPPMSDEDKANMLGDQIGKLMVKCVNLLTAEDPLSLDFCKQQRDLADQYPGELRIVDRMLAHDEYGIALAAFDRKQEALEEFNEEIALLPKAVKPGTIEWSTAYWHRAMIYAQLGDNNRADRDYRAAEASFRKQEREQKDQPDEKMKTVLRQHAALLEKEGKTAEAQKLLAEAAK